MNQFIDLAQYQFLENSTYYKFDNNTQLLSDDILLQNAYESGGIDYIQQVTFTQMMFDVFDWLSEWTISVCPVSTAKTKSKVNAVIQLGQPFVLVYPNLTYDVQAYQNCYKSWQSFSNIYPFSPQFTKLSSNIEVYTLPTSFYPDLLTLGVFSRTEDYDLNQQFWDPSSLFVYWAKIDKITYQSPPGFRITTQPTLTSADFKKTNNAPFFANKLTESFQVLAGAAFNLQLGSVYDPEGDSFFIMVETKKLNSTQDIKQFVTLEEQINSGIKSYLLSIKEDIIDVTYAGDYQITLVLIDQRDYYPEGRSYTIQMEVVPDLADLLEYQNALALLAKQNAAKTLSAQDIKNELKLANQNKAQALPILAPSARVTISSGGDLKILFNKALTFLPNFQTRVNNYTNSTQLEQKPQKTVPRKLNSALVQQINKKAASLIASDWSPLIVLSVISGGSDRDQEQLAFEWKLEQVEERQLAIKINFTNPLYVSTGYDRDKLVVVLNLYDCKDQDKLGIRNSTSIGVYLPQLMQDTEAFAALQAVSSSSSTASSTVLASNAGLNVVLSSTLNQVWSLINNLQLISHMPLMRLKFPGNASHVNSIIASIASFDLLKPDKVFKYIFYFENLEPYNSRFAEAGYTSLYFAENGPTVFYIFHVLILASLIFGFIFLMNKLRCCKCRGRGFYRFKQKVIQIFSAVIIRFFLEGYLENALQAVLIFKFQPQESQTFTNRYNRAILIMLGVFTWLMPILWIILITVKADKLQAISFLRFFEEMIPGIDVEKCKLKVQRIRSFIVSKPATPHKVDAFGVLFEPLWFMLRRLIFLASVLTSLLPQTQLIIQGITSSIHMLYLIEFQPFEVKRMNIIEIFNETILLFIAYLMIGFTDFLESPTDKQRLGWVYVAVIAVNVMFSILLISIDSVKSFILLVRRIKFKIHIYLVMRRARQRAKSIALFRFQKTVLESSESSDIESLHTNPKPLQNPMVQIVLDAALQANTLLEEQAVLPNICTEEQKQPAEEVKVQAPIPVVLTFFQSKEKDIEAPIPEVLNFFQKEEVPIPEILDSVKDLPTIKIEDLVEDKAQKQIDETFNIVLLQADKLYSVAKDPIPFGFQFEDKRYQNLNIEDLEINAKEVIEFNLNVPQSEVKVSNSKKSKVQIQSPAVVQEQNDDVIKSVDVDDLKSKSEEFIKMTNKQINDMKLLTNFSIMSRQINKRLEEEEETPEIKVETSTRFIQHNYLKVKPDSEKNRKLFSALRQITPKKKQSFSNLGNSNQPYEIQLEPSMNKKITPRHFIEQDNEMVYL